MKICFYGLENQTAIDEDISLRTIGYDGAAYRSQLLKGENGELSKDRYPVITVVLYFGTQRWNKPKTLYERLVIPEECKQYVNDYQVNLYEIAWLEEEQIQMFQSDFRIVADYFMQIRKNKNYVPMKETIKHVDEVLKLMSVLTNDERFYQVQNAEKLEGDVTMCEVLDRVEERGVERGELRKLVSQVRKKREKGFPVNEIAELFEEDEKLIKDIDSLLEKYPDAELVRLLTKWRNTNSNL